MTLQRDEVAEIGEVVRFHGSHIVGTFNWQVEGGEITCTEDACNILGFPCTSVTKTFLWETLVSKIILPHRRNFSASVEKSVADRKSFICDLAIIDSDLGKRWVQIRADPNHLGKAIEYFGKVQDITFAKIQKSRASLGRMTDLACEAYELAQSEGQNFVAALLRACLLEIADIEARLQGECLVEDSGDVISLASSGPTSEQSRADDPCR